MVTIAIRIGIRPAATARLRNISKSSALLVDTGAEVITGSTRMKAGNSQKFVLNMISTCAMVKTGKVYENLMINLRPTNIKLRRRMIGIVAEICEVDDTEAERLLTEHGFVIRNVFEAMGKM